MDAVCQAISCNECWPKSLFGSCFLAKGLYPPTKLVVVVNCSLMEDSFLSSINLSKRFRMKPINSNIFNVSLTDSMITADLWYKDNSKLWIKQNFYFFYCKPRISVFWRWFYTYRHCTSVLGKEYRQKDPF